MQQIYECSHCDNTKIINYQAGTVPAWPAGWTYKGVAPNGSYGNMTCPDCQPWHDWEPGQEPDVPCPMCNGQGIGIGRLGTYHWHLCRQCGLQFYVDLAADDHQEPDQDPDQEPYTGHFFVIASSPDVDQEPDQGSCRQ